MILYLNDWTKEKAIVHTNTKNDSFIHMHHVLKKMNIQNNAFFLALNDKDLLDINPFDIDHLTTEEVGKIVYEIKINPWYYFREILRIPASAVEPVPLRLNRASLFIIWAFFNSINIIDIQCRQTGKTIGGTSLVSYCIYFMYNNTNIGLYTHETKLITENIDKLKQIRDSLPPYLITKSSSDTENKQTLRYNALNNGYLSVVAQNTQSGAFGVGRGPTRLWYLLDELPFCSNVNISYPVMMNSTNAAKAFAKAANIPFANIIVTTAGKADTDEGSYVYDMISRSCKFSEKFYDLPNNNTLKTIVANNSTTRMLYGEFSYQQLGYDKEWFDNVVIENNLKPDEIERDLLNRWTFGTAQPAVSPDLLKRADNSKIDPVFTEVIDGYIFRWYEQKEEVFSDPRNYFALGLDTSDNIGNDFTTLHLINMLDLSTVMTARCNDSDLLKLAIYLSKFLIQYKQVTLVPERKSTASMIIAVICKELHQKGINPFTRIYNRVYQNREDPVYNKLDVNTVSAFEGVNKKYLGYTTASSGDNSRDSLYKLTLNKALLLNADRIYDSQLINELKRLSIKNGRIDHSADGHDDTVISFLLAAWFTLYGKNHRYYGIESNAACAKVTRSGKYIDMNVKQRQLELRRRVMEIQERLKITKDPIVKLSLEKELRNLKDDINVDALEQDDHTFDSYESKTTRGITNSQLSNMINDSYTPINYNNISRFNNFF